MCNMTNSTSSTNLNALPSALAGLANVFGDDMFAAHNGARFTCGEADTVAALLVASGHRDAAITWLEGHAEGDNEESDIHRDWDPDGIVADISTYVDALAA
jgi:hypothetical protein